MASQFTSFVTCSVCYELFNSPQILSCCHTFCKTCVERCVRNGELRCPMCKTLCPITDIKPDFQKASLVETYKAEASPVRKKRCTRQDKKQALMCECLSHPVLCKCVTCSKLLCKQCKTSHQGSHRIESLTALANQSRIAINDIEVQINKHREEILVKQRTVKSAMNTAEQTESKALELINKQEESLIKQIQSHHSNLKQRVTQGKNTFINKASQLDKTLEFKLEAFKMKQVRLSMILEKSSEELAQFGPQFHQMAQQGNSF